MDSYMDRMGRLVPVEPADTTLGRHNVAGHLRNRFRGTLAAAGGLRLLVAIRGHPNLLYTLAVAIDGDLGGWRRPPRWP